MHLMEFKFFNNLLDDFVKWAKKQNFFTQDDWEFDDELLPYLMFLNFFS